MKVAIVQEHVDVQRGGAETSTVEMARHLAALGLNVTVVYGEARRHPSAKLRAGSGTEARSVGWPIPSGVGDAKSDDTGVAEHARPPKLRFHPIAVGGGSRVARTIRFVGEADRFCREEGFDIVHAVAPCFSCDVYQPRGGTYVETVRRSIIRTRTPLGRLIKRIGRRFNRRQRFLLLAERQMLTDRSPPFLAALSEYVGRQSKTVFPGFPRERLRVVFNGVDIEPLSAEEAGKCRAAARRELGVDESAPLVLFVAHNFKLKGLGELIRAMSLFSRSNLSPTLERMGHPTAASHPKPSPTPERMGHPAGRLQSEPGAQATGPQGVERASRPPVEYGRDVHATPHSNEGAVCPNWMLAVIGRDNPARYRRLAHRLGIADQVRFLGSRDDLRRLYAAADVLAHPTWYDPCSRVVLEALSCGLPVVTTRFNGAAEVIEDRRHGVVIDSPRDTAALAAAIAECLKAEVREACSADAPRMREQLSMARHARELKALYEEILAPGA